MISDGLKAGAGSGWESSGLSAIAGIKEAAVLQELQLLLTE